MVELEWIKIAKSLNGQRENGSTNKSPFIEKMVKSLTGGSLPSYIYGQPWCGTFVAYCLQQAGFTKGNINCRLLSWDGGSSGANKYPLNWYGAGDYAKEAGFKLLKPCYGCVAIKSRKGGNHVCFVVGRDQKTNKLVCIGGNQGNAVSYALYAESEFNDFMWYGKTQNPSPERYNIPIMSNVTASRVTEA